MPQQRFGGSFAPPLSDDLLAQYRARAEALEPQSPIRDAMLKLLAACEVWWELPESNGSGRPHASGKGVIIDLEPEHVLALWDHVPWDWELKAYGILFDKIDPVGERDLRDAAYHLLWHGWELYLDREPLTADKL